MRTRSRRLTLAALVAVGLVVAVVNAAVLVGGSRRTGSGPVDCALVLGAGVAGDGTPSWVLHDRLAEGLALYRAGRVKRILVSGDHGRPDYDEPNAMRSWLAKHVFGASRIVVVTQRFHLPRALWVARSLGMEAEGAAADRRLYRGAAWFEVREMISRTKAFVDVAGGRRPRHVGPPISLEQDGRVTAG